MRIYEVQGNSGGGAVSQALLFLSYEEWRNNYSSGNVLVSYKNKEKNRFREDA